MSTATMSPPGSVQRDLNKTTEGTGAPKTTNGETSRHDEVAKLAYALWQERGCPSGSAEADWLEAEGKLNN